MKNLPVEPVAKEHRVPRDEVNYRDSHDDILRCAGCSYFAAAGNACAVVEPNDVSPNAVCDLYSMHYALRPEVYFSEDGQPDTEDDVDVYDFLVKAEEDRFTLGVVYEPNSVDAQDHFAGARAIEKAAWEFMASDAKAGLMHIEDAEGSAIGTVVENYIYRGPTWRMKDASGNTRTIKGGSWLLGVVWTNEIWNAIKEGELTGLSLQGRALMQETAA